MVRKHPEHSAKKPRVPQPATILKFNQANSISLDFLWAQSQPYLLMCSQTIKFQSIYNYKGRGKKEKFRTIQQFIFLFEPRGFQITSVHGDNEFNILREKLHPISLDIAARGEHVRDIE